MPKTREEILSERRQLKTQYTGLFDSVAALLFRHDPIGISFEDNTDEYEAEVGTILPRLQTCHSVEDVLRVVHEEFVRWFDDDITDGSKESYKEIAAEIWRLWNEYRGHSQT